MTITLIGILCCNSSIAFTLFTSHAQARGTVSLRSNNPYDKPMVDCRWLGDAHDRAMILEVGRLVSCFKGISV